MLLSLATLFFIFPQNQFNVTPNEFVEKAGELEFTGRMIARPVERDLPAVWSRLAPLSLRFIDETNEFIVQLPEGMNENSFAAELMATGNYEYVHPDWMCYPIGDPNDPKYGDQWHHGVMKSSSAWDLISAASGQIATWVDTGVDHSHPDLAASLIPGYNSADQLEEINGGDTSDINGHGTHVAGCIGAIGNNGVGVAGVVWDIQLMPVRCSNSSNGGAYLSDILDGARWAADNGAKTVSASYSGVENSSVGTTGTDLKNKDALFFYAAGNSGDNWSWFDYPDTIVVGATTSSDVITSWSGRGLALDLVAPGVDILSTVVGGGYQAWSGTSMATPLANGVAAMIFAANPWLSADDVQTRLYESCDDLGPAGEDDTYGMGRVNLRAAVGAAITGPMELDVPVLVAGQVATVSIQTAPPNSTVYFGYSVVGIGVKDIPVLETTAALLNPQLLGIVTTNAAGVGSYSAQVPAPATGVLLWVQAIAQGTSSNYLERTVQ
ncbi:MAG: hypothetical protein COB96_06630 [Planctomycetota bacterium]|nr:MAG: hypothetical protein COB96_06630 [Planctomycetota bacterium]